MPSALGITGVKTSRVGGNSQRRCVPEHCFLLPRVIHFDIV
jgi:hypothetical protein